MKLNKTVLISIVLVASLIAVFFIIRKPKQEDALTLGVFPRRHAAITNEIFMPLAKYLSQEMGRRVLLQTEVNFEDFWEKVRKRRYDIVHYNQYHYIRSHKEQDYEVIAMNQERGKSTITGSIIVRKDSHINKVQDLKGKKILFGGSQKAMQSYIYATYLLKRAGLKEGDYQIRFEANPPKAIVAAYHGLWDAAAAAAGDVALTLPIVTKQVNIKELKILVKGEQYAHLPWAVKRELDRDLKARLKSALLKLKDSPEGKKILKKAKLTAIVEAQDKDFDPHRAIVKEVLGETY